MSMLPTKQTMKKKATFLNLTLNQAKDLQKTLKRRKTRGRTDAEPPLTKNTNHRTRKEIRAENSETLSEERIIEQSEEALTTLKRHSQIGTCPKTLQYKARARVRADEAFKTDIKRIRKTTEQEVDFRRPQAMIFKDFLGPIPFQDFQGLWDPCI
ncbi:unnamed protein product [Porites evermanni]|uniref:Uncharacterized protein n=1 Tax=Porites evermanni TaxID=104178 RepID=A0ABN8RMB9_9CNID|nr:unnamed protein product [Porites evermanni]